ncbi:MAG TPA: enolase C-terminal domain-like protein [Nitrospirales bacterium]|nr:enolase C-terminal domain-like protein [Nitrospirales bacterium]
MRSTPAAPSPSAPVSAHDGPTLTGIDVSAYTVPTETAESDGTRVWDQTTILIIEPRAAGVRGLAYAYGDPAAARLILDTLEPAIRGCQAFALNDAYARMGRAIRESGRSGIAWTAVSAVDLGLWDLKARLLELPLIDLLGPARDAVPVYGSGGFTSAPIRELQRQLAGWVEAGIPRVKMKVARHPEQDERRVAAARAAIGPDAELFVDANGAYSRKQALAFAERFAQYHVTWFEEPVSSDDLDGLRLLRDRGPFGMDITAGEYGFDLFTFRRLLDAGAVDVLQADARRCGGVSGFLRVAALCEAAPLPLSTHTAPTLHALLGCAVNEVRHIEYFHDHVRIEQMLFDGAPRPVHGMIGPDRSRPGFGLIFKRADAERLAKRVF